MRPLKNDDFYSNSGAIPPPSWWHMPPRDLMLANKEVHVWLASLDQPDIDFNRLAQTLSENEITKTRRYHFNRDRRRFIVGRGALRLILGLYTGSPPERLEFLTGANGKPYLAKKCNSDKLMFNVSYANRLILYGFTRNIRIGVDVEHIRAMPDAADIAARFFSKRENKKFQALPQSQKRSAFFQCWTRKEAYLKALGEGISDRLDQFDVSLNSCEPAALLRTSWDPKEADRWSLMEINPGSGYIGTIAVEGHRSQLKYFQFHRSQIN